MMTSIQVMLSSVQVGDHNTYSGILVLLGEGDSLNE